MQELINEAVGKAMAQQEQKMVEAIQETDWSEVAVVHFVQYQPDLARALEGPKDDVEKRDIIGEIEVHRYHDHAPPLDVYADGRRKYNVRTITKPLLERFKNSDVDLPEFNL